jgi:hypothetical protein
MLDSLSALMACEPVDWPIQTSHHLASSVYFLPVTADYVSYVLEKERPDGILLTVSVLTDFERPDGRTEHLDAQSFEDTHLVKLNTNVQGTLSTECEQDIATIQTSHHLASSVYFLPVTADYVSYVLEKERPDGTVSMLDSLSALMACEPVDWHSQHLSACLVRRASSPE